MSSEEFEKLHEMFKSLYDELKLIPDRALQSHGGKTSQLILNFPFWSANMFSLL